MEEKDIDPKTIRTYESDIADAIQHRQTSQVSMVLADEEKKREQDNVLVVNNGEKTSGRGTLIKNLLMILLSLLIIAAGIGAAYYFYKISPLAIKQPSTPAAASSLTVPSSIIVPDKQKVIDITGMDPENILTQAEKQAQLNPIAPGGILEIVFGYQASSTQNGKTTTILTRMTGSQFISAMGLVPPEALTSTLTDQWMFGFYSSDNASGTAASVPFVILTENFFQNAFAGMLKWEPTMPSDLSGLFGIQSSQWSSGSFKDKLVQNKDVREFVDANGNVLFLYSFINNSVLVIAQNEDTLSTIITRFESQAYVR